MMYCRHMDRPWIEIFADTSVKSLELGGQSTLDQRSRIGTGSVSRTDHSCYLGLENVFKQTKADVN